MALGLNNTWEYQVRNQNKVNVKVVGSVLQDAGLINLINLVNLIIDSNFLIDVTSYLMNNNLKTYRKGFCWTLDQLNKYFTMLSAYRL